MKNRNAVILLSVISGVSIPAHAAESYMESQRAQSDQAAEAAYSRFHDSICEQLDLSLDLDNNPFIYTNPDAGCDLGLSMPGLPNLGSIGLGGLDSCKILQSITGDMVDEVNAAMQNSVNEALSGVTEDAMSDYNVDLGDITEESLGTKDDLSGNTTGIDLNDTVDDVFKPR